MKFFTRRDKVDRLSPIAEFWRWWGESGADSLAAAIENKDWGGLPAEMTSRVNAIHPELAWETRAGKSARHALCVTGAGIAELRPTAERWLQSAPRTSETWEFFAARQRDADVATTMLDFSGTSIELARAEIAIEVDDDRQLIHVEVFHPQFSSLGTKQSLQVTFLLLDWFLGEDDVTRWVGGVAAVVTTPADGVPLDALPEIVEAMAARHGEPLWCLADTTTDAGNRRVLRFMRPLRWIDHPHFDLHTEVRISRFSQREDGLPTSDASEVLGAYEERLIEGLGSRGLLVALESAEGQRIFHIYSDSEDANMRDSIDRSRPPHKGVITHTPDPGWKKVDKFK